MLTSLCRNQYANSPDIFIILNNLHTDIRSNSDNTKKKLVCQYVMVKNNIIMFQDIGQAIRSKTNGK